MAAVSQSSQRFPRIVITWAVCVPSSLQLLEGPRVWKDKHKLGTVPRRWYPVAQLRYGYRMWWRGL
jgi:hypothetical protein